MKPHFIPTPLVVLVDNLHDFP